MRRRPWACSKQSAVWLVAMTICLVALPESAHAAELNAQSFALAPALDDTLWVRSARPQLDGAWSLRAMTLWQRDSLVFSQQRGEQLARQRVHGGLWGVDIGAARGWRRWTFEASLPVALVIAGDGPQILDDPRPRGPAFGDLRLGARRHLMRRDWGAAGALDIAVGLIWSAPTGASGSWLSDAGARADAVAMASWRRGSWRVDANLGLRVRPLRSVTVALPSAQDDPAPTTITALAVGSEWDLLVSAGRRWWAGRLGGGLTLHARGPLSSDATEAQVLLETLLRADYGEQRSPWRVWLGLGGAATQAYGAAQFRALVGVQFDPSQVANDADGDGLDDRDDRCPNEAEDRDGFEDGDGCPELDNDQDGIADTVDRCPLQPEDKDGHLDDDGCPDPDNDGDGIVDARDKCPNEPEDVDGFDDHDGCPDPDNDGDGIADQDDFCPDTPEDVDGHDDHDGCPEKEAPPPVQDAGARIRVRRPISFVSGTEQLTSDGRKTLALVIRFINEHKDIKAVAVRVYTDNNGRKSALKQLSVKRAKVLKDALTRGSRLPEHKVTAEGYGKSSPIAPNDTLEGRSMNRRVEFHVLSREPVSPAPKAPSGPPRTRPAEASPKADKATAPPSTKRPATPPAKPAQPTKRPRKLDAAKPAARR